MSNHFYVTTSIPYVNADPHLGFALELVQADVLARHRRLRGDSVRFQTGTDDNSLKNVQAAEAAGVPVRDFVDEHADAFENLRGTLDLSYDDFLRTSRDPRHRPGAERLWQACVEAGDIYRKEYEGLYCVGCEQFYQPDELVEGRCPEHETEPQVVREENWFFRLSRYEDQLAALYDEGRIVIEPAVRANEVRAFIRGGLEDFSISRSVQRAHGWGIPVPGDPTQVMYVWWDALGNYITAPGYGTGASSFGTWWRGDGERRHVIGKGIVRFHAVYWPAMLLSAGLALPTRVFVHDYLTVNGRKIGKSLGNAVAPDAIAATYGTDSLRWWLVAQVPKVGDTDFTEERLVGAVNRDLAGGVGNLSQRVVTMIHRFRHGVVPSAAPSEALAEAANEVPERIDAALESFDLRQAANALTTLIATANRFIEETAPWQLAKTEKAEVAESGRASAELDAVLSGLAEVCRVLASELRPFVPDLAERLARQFTPVDPSGQLPKAEPIFPRLERHEGAEAAEALEK
ncbi:methionine--tRNA ligase [Tenggerimyces flavus]|uniref:Methionine--tRNA ligase n=1 Tax=Tenggerimyces flavus TaxID=1708749 RepID=A0ABV7YJZ0_9ACTN|nr:methionine--tRNA ligase [Tenggerimyces flavus]MBM7784560.1 methionyl-tRNA synthetase [Tenggerimyces flavus]